MASYQFRNVKTGETKVVRSKDSKTARRVYTNNSWVYEKPVSQVISVLTPKVSKFTDKEILEMQLISQQLASAVIELRNKSYDYDVKFALQSASDMESLVSQLQHTLFKR